MTRSERRAWRICWPSRGCISASSWVGCWRSARLAFAASEHASLHWPTKKLAALSALTAGGGYMVLTGMHVPIVRSFAMACLYTVAVLAGRRAISLRGLALAATVLMLLEPEEVPERLVPDELFRRAGADRRLRGAAARAASLRGDGTWTRRFASASGGAGADQCAGGHRLGAVRRVSFRPHPGLFRRNWFVVANMVAVPLTALWVMPAGLIGLAADAVRTRLAGVRADGLGRRRRSSGSRAPRRHCRPRRSTCRTCRPGGWRDRARHRLARAVAEPDAADRACRSIVLGLLSPMLVRPPDFLVSADARLIAVRAYGASVFAARHRVHRSSPASAWLQYWAVGRSRADRPATVQQPTVRFRARTMHACCGHARSRRPRCWCAVRCIRTVATRRR